MPQTPVQMLGQELVQELGPALAQVLVRQQPPGPAPMPAQPRQPEPAQAPMPEPAMPRVALPVAENKPGERAGDYMLIMSLLFVSHL
jgi:hypothetical protein